MAQRITNAGQAVKKNELTPGFLAQRITNAGQAVKKNELTPGFRRSPQS
jgi:hypothetical protein